MCIPLIVFDNYMRSLYILVLSVCWGIYMNYIVSGAEVAGIRELLVNMFHGVHQEVHNTPWNWVQSLTCLELPKESEWGDFSIQLAFNCNLMSKELSQLSWKLPRYIDCSWCSWPILCTDSKVDSLTQLTTSSHFLHPSNCILLSSQGQRRQQRRKCVWNGRRRLQLWSRRSLGVSHGKGATAGHTWINCLAVSSVKSPWGYIL